MNLSDLLLNSFLPCLPGNFRKKIIRGGLPDFQTSLEDVTFQQVFRAEDYMSCFKLVYDVYLEAGFIKPSSLPYRIIKHHSDPQTMVFMGCLADEQAEHRPIYTASMFADNELGLPMDEGFEREVNKLRKKKRRIVEVGCLASDPTYRKGNKNVPMIMNRFIYNHAIEVLHADDLLITVHPKYLKIYEDILLFEKIGELSEYPYVEDNPAVALRLNLRTASEKFRKAYGNKPIGKNLYHFFFGSGSSPDSLPLEQKKEGSEKYYGTDKKNLVINAYSAALRAAIVP
nr:N-acyl-L-homoserine lactone synthetase [uncultured Desulfobacter sp.]